MLRPLAWQLLFLQDRLYGEWVAPWGS